jgi:thiamine kinase-like enzyme
MHHDCKIGNILFDRTTHEVICPIDLDTIMPGKYFSDLGDMIRTMACTEGEESRKWETIDIRKDFYESIVNGYLSAMGNVFTAEEKEHIHKSGLMMIFMQALRFITDFLEGDKYYKTSYPEQNLNRALNQLILLEKLEEFLIV